MIFQRLFTFFVLILAVFITTCDAQPHIKKSKQATVTLFVIDGDTIVVRLNGKKEKVRLTGIDAPEKDGPYTRAEPFNEEATHRVVELVKGKSVTLIFDSGDARDKFARLLAYVQLPDGRTVNEILLTEGLAEAYRKFSYTKKKLYLKLERKAREACRGMWANRGKCVNR